MFRIQYFYLEEDKYNEMECYIVTIRNTEFFVSRLFPTLLLIKMFFFKYHLLLYIIILDLNYSPHSLIILQN